MARLFIVPGPIGNLEDMTFRAVRVLNEVDLILAEDTRTTAKLLQHFGISTRMASHHQHNEHKILGSLLGKLQSGQSLAVVSEAGTPGISDPGFLIIRECLKAGIEVECLPGATAFVPALVCSGLPCERFVFEGFLPVKKGRRSRIDQLKEESRTMVFYESPFRLIKTLKELAAVLEPERQASVSREISKIYEEHVRGTLQELVAEFERRPGIKGEITVVVSGK
ncbi:MAG: 16S rRNA (cytidine(1402)-2'-O)-methyltransferase [Bacteroidales bacterium]